MVRGCCRKAVLAALRKCKHRINPLCTAALAARCTEVTQVTVNTLADFVDYPDTIADTGVARITIRIVSLLTRLVSEDTIKRRNWYALGKSTKRRNFFVIGGKRDFTENNFFRCRDERKQNLEIEDLLARRREISIGRKLKL